MDHMMPDMDGIEAAERIRALGEEDPFYKTLPIIALTANAVVGAREMFLEHGFNDFLSKPIDTLKLNALLGKWIPKKKQTKANAEGLEPRGRAGKSPKLFKVFRGDAEKALVRLRETAASGKIKLFTTTVHAMKSALANIGENAISELASALEKAGHKGDLEYIRANAESFIDSLEALNKRLASPGSVTESAQDADADISEDTAYLLEHLKLADSACENYDDTAAYSALERLREKHWKAKTAAALEHIHTLLFLHSDFEEARNQIQALLLREE